MAASTADYLWVGGHYPVWSICSHGPTAGLVRRLRPKLAQYNAHYMSGHDHCVGHISEKIDGTPVEYILSGAGMSCCNALNEKGTHVVPEGSIKFWAAGPGGGAYQPMPFALAAAFASFSVGDEHMKARFHAHNGSVLYETPPIMPRARGATTPTPTPMPRAAAAAAS
jgi:hypothetical protein